MARFSRKSFIIKFVLFVWLLWLTGLVINFHKYQENLKENLENIEINLNRGKRGDEILSEKIFVQSSEDFPQESRKIVEPPEPAPEALQYHIRLNLTNPGYMGKPVILPLNLPFDVQEKINESFKIYRFNEFVSSLIPLYRELPDGRSDHCKNMIYSDNFPVTSVIMVFFNEPFSMVMRSVFAILNRTPPKLLKEILLVDDCSEYGKTADKIF